MSSNKTIAAFAVKRFLAIFLLLGFTASLFQYTATVSPNSTFHIQDKDGKPVAGLKVERTWDGSDNVKGQDEATTDKDGSVLFKKVAIKRNALKRVLKPLLIFVPASCGPEWETYSSSEFTILWPGHYELKLPPEEYIYTGGGYRRKDGTWVRDPKTMEGGLTRAGRDLRENSIGISFFDRTKDFDFTLKVY